MSSKQYFDNVAGQWDDMRQDFFSEDVREKAYTVAGLAPGKLAADIGAGTGFITEGLVQKGLKVIAIDQSKEMLQELSNKFKSAGNIDCRQGDSARLPIGDETVDYVFANMYLHHVESPSRAVQEMARILKPSGKLVITDLDEHAFNFLKEEHNDRWMGFKREDVVAWFSEAGLRSPQIDCVGKNCCAKSCGGKKADISIFVASGIKVGSCGGNVFFSSVPSKAGFAIRI